MNLKLHGVVVRIRPPIKYADYDMGTYRACLMGPKSSNLLVKFSF